VVEQDFAARWLGLQKNAEGELVLTVKSLITSIGGKWGLIESAIPPMSFSISYGAYKSVYLSAGIAVGLTVLVVIGQVMRKRPVMNALASLVGIGLAAYLALSGGQSGSTARDFFLKDFAVNGIWVVGLLVSVVVRRPGFGYLAHALGDVPDNWQTSKKIRNKMTLMTVFWSVLFATRLFVELPLYLANNVVALGYVKTAFGLPFFGLWIFLSWLLLRRSSSRSI
jgi:hypothetical protein